MTADSEMEVEVGMDPDMMDAAACCLVVLEWCVGPKGTWACRRVLHDVDGQPSLFLGLCGPLFQRQTLRTLDDNLPIALQ